MADQETWARFTRDAWEKGTLYAFVILDPDGTLLGACSLEGVDRQRSAANLSYWVRTSATGRGVARTAARRVLRNKARWAGESHDMAVFSFVPADFAP